MSERFYTSRDAIALFGTVAVFIGAAVAYGIAHDMVTAHLCVEYFSVAHPRVVSSNSPVVLAFVWGVIATWWAGAIVGIATSLSSRVGWLPKLSVRETVGYIPKLLACMASLALVGGVVGWLLSEQGILRLSPAWRHWMPQVSEPWFFADGGAHIASYASGFIGGLAVCVLCVRRRFRARAKLKTLGVCVPAPGAS